ncbi:thioredoxin-like protein [Neocallimastix lanati (nom. inval.)]|uniref:Thioredoxin-like protein n=1 Tax=Neocallimastix californiae TaxID=1754190 RepID=A0A1Y2BK04_9FUNG|nr:thioredoxin-like protein [Neocallimastix sp. JGI-2020a]ORY35104.1 thioredoxin-like protein [Neocallimastix californiae]|eukprot:ORY35104.1 thioredoxin-like protein [Neocallimastix californiae]
MLATISTPLLKTTLPRLAVPFAINRLNFAQNFKRFNSSSRIFEATDDTFKKLISGPKDKKVLVDYYANWCGPCKMLAPIMKEIVDEDENKVLVKVNIDECRETAQEQKINSIPTVQLYINGVQKGEFVGARRKSLVEMFINEFSK